jgi:5-methylthioribose kinase
MALTVDTAALYVARCGCEAECAWAEGFAPEGALAQLILRSIPLGQVLKLPRLLARILRWSLAPHIAAREISDGNVNFSFRLTCPRGRTLFLKHAMGFVKWQPQMALEAERMKREVSYYRDVTRALGEETAQKFQPALLHFDEVCMVLVLQFLDDHELLIERCFTSTTGVPAPAVQALGRYLGLVHASTLEKEGREAESAERAVTYWNPELRAVQLEHVFTVCYKASPRGRALASGDTAFMRELAELKARYLGYGTGAGGQRALCHGDCHAVRHACCASSQREKIYPSSLPAPATINSQGYGFSKVKHVNPPPAGEALLTS